MKIKKISMFFALVALVFFMATGMAAAAPGAIYTTDDTCTGVNLNIYACKDDVYLDGGPAHSGGSGLPDGYYYVKVTEPDGDPLGSSDQTPIHVTNGEFDQCYQLSAILIKASDQTSGYDTTTNPGGEYKVWVSQDSSFPNNESKTDNFKVKGCEGSPPQETFYNISGKKFYDANVDGVWDAGEPGIPFWQIWIYGGLEGFVPYNTTTDAGGNYAFMGLDPGTYNVCEVIPSLPPVWIPTTPTSITGITIEGQDSTDNDFGNVCLGLGGGRTLGFWSNKNGQTIMNDGGTMAPELVMLSALNLRNAGGAHFNPTSYSGFRTWLLSANATNMAYMLSAQLAAMALNVEAGFVISSALVYAPGCGNTGLNNNFITIANLMTAADAQLGTYPLTTAASDPTNRAIQECLKNVLDNANNNKNFVQATPCDVNYSGLELSCVPVP